MSQGTTGGPASGAGLHDAIWGTLGTEGHPTLEELTMAEQSVEVVKGIDAAFATGDVPGVLGAFSEDIEARYTGTGKETGKDLDQTAVHVWNIRDGKAARFRQFMDTVKFAEVVPLDVSVAR